MTGRGDDVKSAAGIERSVGSAGDSYDNAMADGKPGRFGVSCCQGVGVSEVLDLERDRLNPTVGTLKSVATALNITIGSLFATSPTADHLVVRAAHRKLLRPRQGITYELLTPDLTGQIEFFISRGCSGARTSASMPATARARPSSSCATAPLRSASCGSRGRLAR